MNRSKKVATRVGHGLPKATRPKLKQVRKCIIRIEAAAPGRTGVNAKSILRSKKTKANFSHRRNLKMRKEQACTNFISAAWRRFGNSTTTIQKQNATNRLGKRHRAHPMQQRRRCAPEKLQTTSWLVRIVYKPFGCSSHWKGSDMELQVMVMKMTHRSPSVSNNKCRFISLRRPNNIMWITTGVKQHRRGTPTLCNKKALSCDSVAMQLSVSNWSQIWSGDRKSNVSSRVRKGSWAEAHQRNMQNNVWTLCKRLVNDVNLWKDA